MNSPFRIFRIVSLFEGITKLQNIPPSKKCGGTKCASGFFTKKAISEEGRMTYQINSLTSISKISAILYKSFFSLTLLIGTPMVLSFSLSDLESTHK